MGGRTFTFLGTPEYMAPELVKRTGYGKGVDYWALGCLIVEMLSGSTPFLADTTPAIYKRILTAAPQLGQFDPVTKDIVEGLCDKNEFARLGVDGGAAELKRHQWFDGLDWDALVRREVPPPWVPDITDQVRPQRSRCRDNACWCSAATPARFCIGPAYRNLLRSCTTPSTPSFVARLAPLRSLLCRRRGDS